MADLEGGDANLPAVTTKQPLRHEPDHGFPNRRARNTELADDPRFIENRTRDQVQGKDPLPQILVNAVGIANRGGVRPNRQTHRQLLLLPESSH
ncbi:hypothetical protein NLM33_01685 [Bradyrhizobium sp. CCGUVB1N3]|nr:hypothetical protein [Bradyrhizobium sp. CCGUVB1N3]MCP3469031.1 hypothetical protein [Bradyrhizobium sp. CCGUVB1N3]